MNTPRRPASPPSTVHERDWLAQERALGAPGADRRDALLVQALRTPAGSQPPPGFAADIARRVLATDVPVRADDGGIERLLLNALLLVLAGAVLAVVALYGGDWWALGSAALGRNVSTWALLGAACLALSWLPGGARRLYEATRAASPA